MRSRLIAALCFFSLAARADITTTLTDAQLDQLTAPIALYPDALLAQVLMAATDPQDLVRASDWLHADGTGLSGDALATALEPLPWDPSVKALVPFPQVLDRMAADLAWTTQLGEAVRTQRPDVMASVQRLRKQALANGRLDTQDRIVVSESNDIVIITPSQPTVVYVPMYDPWTVYGPWPYPAYPPYAFGPSFGFGYSFGFGTGVVVAPPLWGYGGFDWHHRDFVVDRHRWDQFDGHRGDRSYGVGPRPDVGRMQHWEPPRNVAPIGPRPITPGPSQAVPPRIVAPVGPRPSTPGPARVIPPPRPLPPVPHPVPPRAPPPAHPGGHGGRR